MRICPRPWDNKTITNSYMLLTSIPTENTVFTLVSLCSAYFSIPVDGDSQYVFAFVWEGQQCTWTVSLRALLTALLRSFKG